MLAQEPPLITSDPTFGMRVETPKGGRSIGFLTHGQAKALLGAAEVAVRPALALMLFAGIRHNELHREAKTDGVDFLQWSDIDIPNRAITVRHEVAKTGVARTVRNIPENLWAWLPADRAGLVCPVHLRTALDRARAKLENPPAWSKSILRHSCASHHAAAFENLPATALLIRHEGDVTLLNRRYREGVKITRVDGLAYFKILPELK
jgi:integrase